MRAQRVQWLASSACVLVTFAGAPNARGTCLEPKRDSNSAADFVLASIDALAHAQVAYIRVEQTTARETSGPFELLVSLKESVIELDCSELLLRPFKESSNEQIKPVAYFAGVNYGTLSKMHQEYAELCKQELDGRASDEPPGSRAERMANLSAALHEKWMDVSISGNAATYGIVETEPATGKLRLSLSAAARRESIERLRHLFGKAIEGGSRDGQTPPEAGAAEIYRVLTDKGFKTRVEK